jgi:hypothetical protein
MRSTIAFALVGAALAAPYEHGCPANSVSIAKPYRDMRDCKCESGFEPYPFPSWGCYEVTPTYTCPSHSATRDDQKVATSRADCKCEEGWAPYTVDDNGTDKFTCVYAYVFHVHGRVWLQPFTASEFGYKEEVDFQKAMSSVLNVKQSNVLPYSVQDVANVRDDLANARLGYAKLLLAENEDGEISKQSGASIGFAVRLRGDSMKDGHDLVDLMKDPKKVETMLATWKTIVSEPAFTKITYSNMFVWALTAEFWKPSPTVEAGEICTHDYECKPAPGTKPVSMTCRFDRSTGDKRCRYPFSWAPKHPTEPPTPAPPTPAPTPLPAGKFYRATVEFTMDLACQCSNVPKPFTRNQCLAQNSLLSYIEFHAGHRAALLEGAAKALAVPPEHMYIKSVVPVGVPADEFSSHFNPRHLLKKGLVITLGFQAFTFDEVKAVTEKIKARDQLASDVATQTTSVGWGLTSGCITIKDEIVQAKPLDTEQLTITPAPTPVVIPGSDSYCGTGSSIVVDGSSKLISTKSLTTHEAGILMNQYRKCIDTAMAYTFPTPYGNVEGTSTQCIAYTHVTQFGAEDKVAWYNDADKGNQFLYKYSFQFSTDLPTQDMTAANTAVDAVTTSAQGSTDIAFKSSWRSAVNKCVNGNDFVWTDADKFEGDKDFLSGKSSRINNAELKMVGLSHRDSAPTPAPTSHVDCEVSQFTDWTECSKSCGDDGVSTRFRVIITDGFADGKRCKATCTTGDAKCTALHETQPCNVGKPCPVNCKLTQWGGYSVCSKTCGIGYKTRAREVEHPGNSIGKPCSTHREDKRECSMLQFCPVDCTLSSWGSWSDCSKKCNDGNGAGKRIRRRFVENSEFYGGEPCAKDDMRQEETCNENACPVDCVVSGWSAWGSCSKTCAGKAPGTRLFGARQERTRYIVTPDKDGGRPCPVLTQTKLCALHPCGAHVCTTNKGFPLTCTFERGIVYTHHVNDVHDNELFMCYHNFVTEVCTCLCWPRNVISTAQHSGASDISSFVPSV